MLPEKFEKRMKNILKDEYDAFRSALEEDAVKGIRVNQSSVSVEDFLKVCDRALSPIPYTEDGFIPENTDGIGRSAEHHAGMIYVQDPGAMATVNALDIKDGSIVLDACSAPGGKTSQLASAAGECGFVLANEYVAKRAKIVVSNLERLGIRNAVVTSLDTAAFPDMFSSVFDVVLCDAPCSGEGMFRKYDEALTEWSEENVLFCAQRQKQILDNCAPCVKAGGYLIYSTCTYSPEENEEVIISFLDSHTDFELCAVKDTLISVTSDGLDLSNKYDLKLTRRFYPHISKGEGQYIALLKKNGNSSKSSSFLYKSDEKSPSKEEILTVEKFFSDNLVSRPKGKLVKAGEGVALLPFDFPIPKSSVFMSGVMVGEVKKGILTPHHQFFSAYGKDFVRKEYLKKNDPRVEKYLRGEEIEGISCKSGGYVAVMYENVPLGGGKASGGRIKNHYPKGLRNK